MIQKRDMSYGNYVASIFHDYSKHMLRDFAQFTEGFVAIWINIDETCVALVTAKLISQLEQMINVNVTGDVLTKCVYR